MPDWELHVGGQAGMGRQVLFPPGTARGSGLGAAPRCPASLTPPVPRAESRRPGGAGHRSRQPIRRTGEGGCRVGGMLTALLEPGVLIRSGKAPVSSLPAVKQKPLCLQPFCFAGYPHPAFLAPDIGVHCGVRTTGISPDVLGVGGVLAASLHTRSPTALGGLRYRGPAGCPSTGEGGPLPTLFPWEGISLRERGL